MRSSSEPCRCLGHIDPERWALSRTIGFSRSTYFNLYKMSSFTRIKENHTEIGDSIFSIVIPHIVFSGLFQDQYTVLFCSRIHTVGMFTGGIWVRAFFTIAQPSVERANKSSPYLRKTLTTESVIFSCFFRACLHPSISILTFQIIHGCKHKSVLISETSSFAIRHASNSWWARPGCTE